MVQQVDIQSHSDRGRADSTKEAWWEYLHVGHLMPGRVREQTYQAWRRSKELGCDPYLLKAQVLSSQETSALLEKERDLIQAAHPYLVALSRAAGAERHAAMLGDRRGVVLEIVGDQETVRDPTFPSPGALLSEAVAGANGIGTALAVGGYAELVGPEHFIEGFHVYTCQGVPIRNSENEVVGVLSTSVRRVEAAERIHEILISATHGIEAALRSGRIERAISRLLSGPANDLTASLKNLRDDLMQSQAASWLQLQSAIELLNDNEKKEALSLLEVATHLSGVFKKQADLWRQLAEDSLQVPQPVDLAMKIPEFVDLLKTEANIRQVELRVVSRELPVLPIDWGDVSRLLLRSLLRAFESAERGGRVELDVIPAQQGVEFRTRILNSGDH